MNQLRLPCNRLMYLIVVFTVITASALGSGCDSDQKAKLDSAITAYNAGIYQRAFDQARSSRLSASGTLRDESAYVAGLAAMKIDRPVTARGLLEEASGSRNTTVAGRADASLGTLLLADGEPLAAARAYDRAVGKLTGPDRVRARNQAAEAYQKAGMSDLARERRGQASNLVSTLPGRFTIQGGFYADRTGAVRRAEQLSIISDTRVQR